MKQEYFAEANVYLRITFKGYNKLKMGISTWRDKKDGNFWVQWVPLDAFNVS